MADALKTADELKADLMNSLDDPSPSPAPAPAEPTAPAAEPATPTATATDVQPNPAPTPEPTATTEPKEGDKDWKVPGERLQEEVKKRKEVEEELASLKAAQEAAAKKTDPVDDPADDEDLVVDPDLLKALKKQGFVTRAEAEKLAEDRANGILSADKKATEARQQAAVDVQDLTKEFADKGYPAFNVKELLPKAIEMVGEAHVNKQVLRAAYLETNASEIENVLVKQANATKTAPTANAERPGGQPAVGAGGTGEVKTVEQSTKDKILANVPD